LGPPPALRGVGVGGAGTVLAKWDSRPRRFGLSHRDPCRWCERRGGEMAEGLRLFTQRTASLVADVGSDGLRDGLGPLPTGLEALVNRVVGHPGSLAAGFQRRRVQSALPPVGRLLFWGRPAAVLRAVTSFVVDSFEGPAIRALPHIAQKRGKRPPSWVDGDSSASIVVPPRVARVGAPLPHRLPGEIGWAAPSSCARAMGGRSSGSWHDRSMT
jgi:hypothetical protein